MKRLDNPSQSQLIAIGVLLTGIGAIFAPPLQVSAQPSESNITTGANEAQATAIPQPLATPTEAQVISAAPATATSSQQSPRAVGTISGQGTAGYISKFTGPNAIGNSVLFENAGKIGIGLTNPAGLLSIKGTANNVYPLYVLNTTAGNAILGSSTGGIGVYGLNSGVSDAAGVLGETSSTSANATGVQGTSKATSPGTNAAGVRGLNAGTNANGYGVYGSHAGGGVGVYGTSQTGTGVDGTSISGNAVLGDSTTGTGVRGRHMAATGTFPGVFGATNSTDDNSSGVQGVVNSTNPGDSSVGVRGVNNGTGVSGIGVYGSQAGSGVGVYGMTPNGNGVIGQSSTSTGVSGVSTSGFGAAGQSTSNYGIYGESSQNYGVYGISSKSNGVYGTATNAAGVYGTSSQSNGVYGTANNAAGVYGISSQSDGVYGTASSAAGVHGYSASYSGVRGDADGGEGVTGVSSTGRGVVGTGSIGVVGNGPTGVVGNANSANGYADGVKGVAYSSNSNSAGIEGNDGNGGNGPAYAGYFYGRVYIQGNLSVTGTLSKGAGSFKIDHPLHPATEYLSHSFVESPDMMNVYNGNTKTNAQGEVWVQLPNYFSALNRDFRYQLTPMGQFAQAIVGQKISGNRFLIRTDKPNVEVSWQVTGIRNDAYARQHRIKVEETKTEDERGKYLYPAGFGAGQDKQIGAPHARLASR